MDFNFESDFKQCSKCKEMLPLSSFTKSTKSRDGLYYSCKKCKKVHNEATKEQRAAYQKKYNEEHKEHLDEKKKQYYLKNKEDNLVRQGAHPTDTDLVKQCSKCKKLLSLDQFDKSLGRISGLYSSCKKCRKTQYESTKEQKLSYQKRYTMENKEQISMKNRERYVRNRDRIIEKQKRYALNRRAEKYIYDRKRYNLKREMILEKQAQYNEEHREQLREKARLYRQTPEGKEAQRRGQKKYRVRKMRAAGSHTGQEIQDQLYRQGHKCYYCKIKLNEERHLYHADHIVPLSRGGTDYIDNIVLTCPKCNLCKNDKLLHEWLDGGRLC